MWKVSEMNVPYGRKYWRGIIFGGWQNQARIVKILIRQQFYCIKMSIGALYAANI